MTEIPMMKAVVINRYGPPETLALHNLPVPVPSASEVRIRVRTTTVTRTDTATLRAHPFFARAMTGLFKPNMQILGVDFAGTVDTVGADVTRFQPGDRVFGLMPELFGAHAEFLCTPAAGAIAHIPDGIEFEKAVVCEGAWYANSTTSLLSTGQRCLIYGASGAIGTAAVQLARARGATVTAVVGTRHMELAEKLGADRVINYQQTDFTSIKDRFDLVFDAVGKTSWFACRHLLKDKGIFCATDLGPAWSNIFLSAWYGATGSQRVRIPFPQDATDFVQHLAELMETGQFAGVFDRYYDLENIVDAFRYVEAGQKTGIVGVNIG